MANGRLLIRAPHCFCHFPTRARRGELPCPIGCVAHKLHSLLPLSAPGMRISRHMPVENEIDEQRALALLTPSRGPSDVNLNSPGSISQPSPPLAACVDQWVMVGLGKSWSCSSCSSPILLLLLRQICRFNHHLPSCSPLTTPPTAIPFLPAPV